MASLLSLPDDVKVAAFPFVAKSIEIAHQYAPARWGLSPQTADGFIRLNVVMTEVLTINSESVRVFVNADVAKDTPAVKSQELKMEGAEDNGDYYRSSSGSRLIEIPHGSQQAELLLQMFPAHAENIRLTAKRGGIGRGVRSAHNDEAVNEIGSFLGRELPLPLYSYDQQAEADDSNTILARMEGAQKEVLSIRRERSSTNRENAIKVHGVTCQACGFNFESVYGEHGFGYIEVHHNALLSNSGGETLVDPREDLTVLCANCHAMVHRDRNPLSLEALKKIINPEFPVCLAFACGKATKDGLRTS